jgi:acyl-coenzyme A synthetase/AMP-(fatty) acid ligase
MTIIETTRSRVRPRDAAIVVGARTWTYEDLFGAVDLFAAYLRRRHPAGQPLVAQLTDPFAAAVVTLGCDATGTPVIHQDPAGHPATPEALVCDGQPPAWRPFGQAGTPGLFVSARRGPDLVPELPPHSQTFLTSGSTGVPVGVIRGADAVLADAERIAAFLGYTPQTPVLVAAPLSHLYGFAYGLTAPLLSGAPARYCRARSVPSQLRRAAAAHGARTVIALPLHYKLLADGLAGGADPGFTGVTRAVSSGAPLTPGVGAALCRRAAFTLYNGYGSSEAGAVTLRPTTGTEEAHDVGEPLPGVSMRVDSEGSQPGELMLRTSSLALGRIIMEDRGTLSALPQTDGWYRTGDLAWPSTTNHIRLAGRIGLMFKVGGKQVNPVEIEQVLAAHPEVVDVQVLAEADGTRGKIPVAHVVLRDGSVSIPLVEWCRQRLAPHQLPRRIELVTSIPRSATGKVVAAGE